MKRKNIIAFSVALMAIGAFTSCSDEFLQDKKNYDYVDASTYNTFSGAKARVDDIYAWCLPNTSSEPSWKYNSTGAADLQSKSTEETIRFLIIFIIVVIIFRQVFGDVFVIAMMLFTV